MNGNLYVINAQMRNGQALLKGTSYATDDFDKAYVYFKKVEKALDDEIEALMKNGKFKNFKGEDDFNLTIEFKEDGQRLLKSIRKEYGSDGLECLKDYKVATAILDEMIGKNTVTVAKKKK